MASLAAQLRQKINSRSALGTFVKLGRREVIEILALAGLDFAICDLEHSQITEAEASQMIATGKSCGLPVIVRVAAAIVLSYLIATQILMAMWSGTTTFRPVMLGTAVSLLLFGLLVPARLPPKPAPTAAGGSSTG